MGSKSDLHHSDCSYSSFKPLIQISIWSDLKWSGIILLIKYGQMSFFSSLFSSLVFFFFFFCNVTDLVSKHMGGPLPHIQGSPTINCLSSFKAHIHQTTAIWYISCTRTIINKHAIFQNKDATFKFKILRVVTKEEPTLLPTTMWSKFLQE